MANHDFFENIAVKAGKFSRAFREQYINQYLNNEDYSNAEKALDIVLQYDQRWALGYYLMYQIKLHAGLQNTAAEYIAKALELRPDKFIYRDTYLDILLKKELYNGNRSRVRTRGGVFR